MKMILSDQTSTDDPYKRLRFSTSKSQRLLQLISHQKIHNQKAYRENAELVREINTQRLSKDTAPWFEPSPILRWALSGTMLGLSVMRTNRLRKRSR